MIEVDGHLKVHPHMRGLLRGLLTMPLTVMFITFPHESCWFIGSGRERLRVLPGTLLPAGEVVRPSRSPPR
ncbi:hypothetical protein BU52_01205 [Streptomyces toyocaensis]|uniref:Uncharacterized protein n=1 Tax=Streptomyces toyocaensis TaxID=55952 RepID=A0A081XYS4_STRTO|nr:hypothetical protein BU52_01205 [Streptomyces toyocaensis]